MINDHENQKTYYMVTDDSAVGNVNYACNFDFTKTILTPYQFAFDEY